MFVLHSLYHAPSCHKLHNVLDMAAMTTMMALTQVEAAKCEVKNPGSTSVIGFAYGSQGASCSYLCFK